MKRFTLLIMMTLPWLSIPLAGMGQSDTEDLRDTVTRRLPGRGVDHFAATPIEGLYEVAIGSQVLYVSADGRYAVAGRLVDLETREDLTEQVLAKLRLDTLEEVPESRMIIYEPEGEVKHTITTFTDIDCPYCRKMHREMGELNRLGIRVRYMLFPRAGVGSISYEKAVSVWCAPDQREEMTRAKAGKMPELRECDNPVRDHMALAERMGLTGTPYTITDTGRVVGGYSPANQLFASLEVDKQLARQ